MASTWHSVDRAWAHRVLLPVAIVSVLVVSACTADPDRQPSPGSPEELLGQEWPPPGDEVLRGLAEGLRLDDPPQDVEFERYISPEEYAGVMVPCLTEQGIPARPLPDGGVGFGDIPPEQAQAQREALYRCWVRFPTHPLFERPLDDDQLRRLYDYNVGELTACLEREGYTVPPPPSLEAFIESYSDPETLPWNPYPADDPRLEREAEWYRLNQACPQIPPLDVLYGRD